MTAQQFSDDLKEWVQIAGEGRRLFRQFGDQQIQSTLWRELIENDRYQVCLAQQAACGSKAAQDYLWEQVLRGLVSSVRSGCDDYVLVFWLLAQKKASGRALESAARAEGVTPGEYVELVLRAWARS